MRKLSVSTGAGMSRQSKSVPQAKKVMPPAVPDMYGKIGLSNGNGPPVVAGGPLPTAVIYDTSDGAGRNGAVVAGTVILEHHHGTEPSGSGANVTNVVPVGSSGVGSAAAVTGTTTVAASSTTLTAPSSLMLRCGPDGIMDYGLDDQGIDLTQSPGRDSPVSLSGSAGSGSRHSTASLDSGRASSYLTGASNSSNRSVSGVGSYGVLSSPRCSVSSCSIGSGSATGGTAGGCSHRLSNHSSGGRSDHDVISEWLMEIHFHEYTYLFLEAGYDLPTIARMTPEDLTAIGIRKPNHRERLKRHIDTLKLPDTLPGYVPGSIDEWLRLLRLDEYVQPLLAQGYQTVHDVTQLTWEDLEDIGIVKLGHQKKILLAIKRVKDIISGKMMVGGPSGTQLLAGYALSPTIARMPVGRVPYDDMSIGLRSDSSKQQHLAVAGSYSTFLRQQTSAVAPPPPSLTTVGGGSEAGIHFGHGHVLGLHQHHHQMITYPHVHFDGTQAVYRRSSYDDSDITPTNEKTSALLALTEDHHHYVAQQQQQQTPAWLMHPQQQQQQQQQLMQHQQLVQHQQYFQGGGTLPRQHPRNNYGVRLAMLSGPNSSTLTTRQRPIAKIVANNLKPALDDSVNGGVDGDGSGSGSAVYPVPMSLPPMLGQIENVEMATAALDAMHFSNYTSSPYVTAVQHHHLHLHGPSLVSGSPGAAVSVIGPPQQQSTPHQQQQQSQQAQPIYHNHQSMLMHSQSQQPLMHHHSSSVQSTPSPPNLIVPGGCQQPALHASMVPFGYAGQTLQTTAEVHKVCGNDNKSNSSLESIDQIPFANENAGTIKQRSSLNRMEHQFQPPVSTTQQQQQHHPLLLPTLSSSSSTSSSSSSLTGSITTTLASGCIQQQLSPSASAPITVPNGVNPSGAASGPSSASQLVNKATTGGAITSGGPSAVAGTADETTASASSGSTSQDIFGTNVLKDIGHMLANLTDELDAMLEEEKCAGISDNE